MEFILILCLFLLIPITLFISMLLDCKNLNVFSRLHRLNIVRTSGEETIAVCTRCASRWYLVEAEELTLLKRGKKKW